MSDRPYKPGPSKIHGLGVIATRLIRAGEFISVDLGPEYHGFNHSCEYNLSDRTSVSKHRVALRDVEPGSELTVDYSGWYGGRLGFICNCPKCRKENDDV